MDLSELPDRISAKIEFDGTSGCWNWAGAVMKDGYGRVQHHGRVALVHRAVYEIMVGPIPAEKMLDHRCFVRRCVNPEHLRFASRKQNGEHRRGAQSNSATGVRGVTVHHGRYRAVVQHNGKKIWGGYHSTLEAADHAASALRAELFTHDDH